MGLNDITEVIKAACYMIVAICTTFVIPWLKKKMGTENYLELQNYVTVGVKAAEQIFIGTGLGEKKKLYVEQFLGSLGYDINSEEINALIESAVLELKKA